MIVELEMTVDSVILEKKQKRLYEPKHALARASYK